MTIFFFTCKLVAYSSITNGMSGSLKIKLKELYMGPS